MKCRQNAALTGTKALGELNREPSSIFWFQSHMPGIACSHWLEIIPKTFPLTAHMHKTCNTMCTHTCISTNSNQNNKRKKSKQLQPTPNTEEGFCEDFFFFLMCYPSQTTARSYLLHTWHVAIATDKGTLVLKTMWSKY